MIIAILIIGIMNIILNLISAYAFNDTYRDILLIKKTLMIAKGKDRHVD